jgi:hypothetical protein
MSNSKDPLGPVVDLINMPKEPNVVPINGTPAEQGSPVFASTPKSKDKKVTYYPLNTDACDEFLNNVQRAASMAEKNNVPVQMLVALLEQIKFDIQTSVSEYIKQGQQAKMEVPANDPNS